MILILIVGFVLLAFVIYRGVIYALPGLIGLGAGKFAFDTGAGEIGAIAVGIIAALSALRLMQFCFQHTRSAPLRFAFAALFCLPAAVVGYYAVLDLCAAAGVNSPWTTALSIFAAAYVSLIAFRRLANEDV